MHLQYLQSDSGGEVLVLGNDRQWRIEMYVLANDDDTFSLVALAGKESLVNEKIKVQGPYQDRSEAVAARSAIAGSLVSDGFSEGDYGLAQWRIAAQRAIREVRDAHRSFTTDCRFNPDDVYFD